VELHIASWQPLCAQLCQKAGDESNEYWSARRSDQNLTTLPNMVRAHKRTRHLRLVLRRVCSSWPKAELPKRGAERSIALLHHDVMSCDDDLKRGTKQPLLIKRS
jgi:hypothetical protein